MSRKKPILPLLIVLVLMGGGAYYGYTHFMMHGAGGAPAGAGGMDAPPVSVAEVIERDVQPWHEFSGRLVAVDQAEELRPQVSGIIESVHFKNGARVKKGDLLFTIDPRPYQAALESSMARSAYADAEFQRAQRLHKDNAMPQSEYDQKHNNAEVARADLAVAKLNLDYCQVKSPITGKVSRAEITEGNLVESGATAPLLTTIVADSAIYADFDVDEETYLRNALSKVEDGKDTGIPVEMGLSNENGTPREGHIEAFDNRLATGSGTIRARAVFENPEGALVPGLFARIRLGDPTKMHATLITDRAVGTDQNKKFVIVVGAGNATEHREVTLGGLVDGLRVVQAGVKPGEKIVVNGLQRIMMPGMPVKPEMVAMDAPPGAAPAMPEAGKPDAAKKVEKVAPAEKITPAEKPLEKLLEKPAEKKDQKTTDKH